LKSPEEPFDPKEFPPKLMAGERFRNIPRSKGLRQGMRNLFFIQKGKVKVIVA
jgi:hypothetical protein